MEERIIGSIEGLLHTLDALILIDQVDEKDCGAVTQAVVKRIADIAPQHRRVIFWADSRRRIGTFRNVIIKPNQFEAVGWENAPPDASVGIDELVRAVTRLREQNGAPVVATRGPEGMLVSDPEPTLVPGVRVPGPIDSTGAGDSATAGTVLALAAGATLPEAAVVGNLVASITVQQLATTGVARPDQLLPRLAMWREQTRC